MYLRGQFREAKRYVPRGFVRFCGLQFRGHSVQFSSKADKIDFPDGDDAVDP